MTPEDDTNAAKVIAPTMIIIIIPVVFIVSPRLSLKFLNDRCFDIINNIKQVEAPTAAASVGVAIPTEKNHYGYLSEHHSYGQNEKEAGDYAEDLAASMLASTLGIEFDPETAYDERKDIFKMSGKIVKTRNITQTAEGKRDCYTTVIAAAVFVMK